MLHGWRLRALLAAMFLAQAPPLFARTIQIVITTKVSVVSGALQVDIETANSGDEPAMTVMPTIEFRGAETAGSQIAALYQGATDKQRVVIPATDLDHLGGVWPVLVRVSYQDANRRAFEAIHATTIQIGSGTPQPSVTLTLGDARIETSGAITARIEATTASKLRIRFFAPPDLKFTPQAVEVMTELSGSTSIPAVVTTTATPASRLPIFAVGEYDSAAGHETVLAVAMVETAPEASSPLGERVITILIGALVLTWILLAVSSWRRRRGSRNAA